MKHISLFLVMSVALTACGPDNGKDGIMGPAGANGQPGSAGPQGPMGSAGIQAVIDPCGDDSNVLDEVVIVLNDGQLLRSQPYLQALTPGTYHTNDGTHCQFTVSPDYVVSW